MHRRTSKRVPINRVKRRPNLLIDLATSGACNPAIRLKTENARPSSLRFRCIALAMYVLTTLVAKVGNAKFSTMINHKMSSSFQP